MPVPPGIRVDLTPQGVVMSGLVIGYATVSTEEQDLTAQRDGLATLGVDPSRIYVDHGLTGTNRERPGLREALAACRAGDTLVVTKLDRLARSLPDARAIAEDLTKRKVRLSLGASVYDPTDPVGRLLFNVLAMVAEFEADLIRSRTREGMRVAKAKGHLRGKQPKLNPRQEAHLVELLHSGQYSTAEIRRPVRRGPLHRVSGRRPQQDRGDHPANRRYGTGYAGHSEGARPRRRRQLGDRHLPAATRRTQRASVEERQAFSRANRAPGQRAPNGTLRVSNTAARIVGSETASCAESRSPRGTWRGLRRSRPGEAVRGGGRRRRFPPRRSAR
jgi:DNA invertase Pin-like site-specific DNA recombinase